MSLNGCLTDYAWCDVHDGLNRGWVDADSLFVYRGAQPYTLYDASPWFTYPIVTFYVGDYWRRHYYNRPWYHDRHRYDRWDWRHDNRRWDRPRGRDWDDRGHRPPREGWVPPPRPNPPRQDWERRGVLPPDQRPPRDIRYERRTPATVPSRPVEPIQRRSTWENPSPIRPDYNRGSVNPRPSSMEQPRPTYQRPQGRMENRPMPQGRSQPDARPAMRSAPGERQQEP